MITKALLIAASLIIIAGLYATSGLSAELREGASAAA